MKERPILFQAEMVRAILDGRKTQTRRIIKPQPIGEMDTHPDCLIEDTDGGLLYFHPVPDSDVPDYKCPYGKVGDRLWVRETMYNSDFNPSGNFYYKADNKGVGNFVYDKICEKGWSKKKTIPSIHMHRWASRITLEIVNIRIERIQDISEVDAKAEGVEKRKALDELKQVWHFYKMGFAYLWNLINEKRGYGWDKNPWVWVVEFRRVADG